MHRVLLVDGNPIVWGAAYAGPMDEVSGTFLMSLGTYMERVNPHEVIVSWDVGKSRWRRALYPDYKAQRQKKHQESNIDRAGMEEQSFFVRRFLDAVGIRQVWSEGVEADDILAWLSEYFIQLRSDIEVVIVTGDRDLWQLITDRVQVYDLNTKERVGKEHAEAFFSLSPGLIPSAKALAGDTSDNLPGIFKVGEKTAAALLHQYGGLSEILEPLNAKELSKKKSTSRILSSGDFLGEMYRLVKLPSLKDAYFTLSATEYSALREKLLMTPVKDPFQVQILSGSLGYGFGKFMSHLPTFSTPLQGMVDILDSSTLARGDECSACSGGPFTPFEYMYKPRQSSDFLVVCQSPLDLVEGSPEEKLLQETLVALDILPSECVFTGACMCPIQFPQYGQIMACKIYLSWYLKNFHPKLVISFGTVPMMMFTEHTSNSLKYSGVITDRIEGLVGSGEGRVAILPNLSDALRAESCKVDFDYGVSVIRKFLNEVTNVNGDSGNRDNSDDRKDPPDTLPVG